MEIICPHCDTEMEFDTEEGSVRCPECLEWVELELADA